MKDLEAKMAEAKAKKDQISARARTAKASTKVNDMLAGAPVASVEAVTMGQRHVSAGAPVTFRQ